MGAFTGLGPLSGQTGIGQTQADLAIRALNAPRSATDGSKIDKAAQDFEAVLVGTWLQEAEASFATVPGTDDDEEQDVGRSQMMSLGIQSLSTSMAASGGFGIAKMIAKALHATEDKTNEESKVTATGETGASTTK